MRTRSTLRLKGRSRRQSGRRSVESTFCLMLLTLGVACAWVGARDGPGMCADCGGSQAVLENMESAIENMPEA